MFQKTKKRIYRTLLLLALLLIALIVIPSIAMFSDVFYSTYESTAKNKLDRSISASRMYIDSIMATTDNLALNPEIIQTLSGQRTSSLTPLLDATCTYSLDIGAITVYGLDDSIYTSSGVVNPPEAEELTARSDIAEFFADRNADEYVSLRTSKIIKAYNNVPYDEQLGIISYCRKVYGTDGDVIGYIFSDIFPHDLFEYFNIADNRLDGSVIMIAFSGGYFSSDHSEETEEYLRAEADTIVGSRLIISSTRNFYGGTIRAAVPLSPLYNNILLISGIILLIGAALLCAVHLIARAAANQVTNQLNELLLKMTESTQKINGL